jgi:hypothetical protein
MCFGMHEVSPAESQTPQGCNQGKSELTQDVGTQTTPELTQDVGTQTPPVCRQFYHMLDKLEGIVDEFAGIPREVLLLKAQESHQTALVLFNRYINARNQEIDACKQKTTPFLFYIVHKIELNEIRHALGRVCVNPGVLSSFVDPYNALRVWMSCYIMTLREDMAQETGGQISPRDVDTLEIEAFAQSISLSVLKLAFDVHRCLSGYFQQKTQLDFATKLLRLIDTCKTSVEKGFKQWGRVDDTTYIPSILILGTPTERKEWDKLLREYKNHFDSINRSLEDLIVNGTHRQVRDVVTRCALEAANGSIASKDIFTTMNSRLTPFKLRDLDKVIRGDERHPISICCYTMLSVYNNQLNRAYTQYINELDELRDRCNQVHAELSSASKES